MYCKQLLEVLIEISCSLDNMQIVLHSEIRHKTPIEKKPVIRFTLLIDIIKPYEIMNIHYTTH